MKTSACKQPRSGVPSGAMGRDVRRIDARELETKGITLTVNASAAEVRAAFVGGLGRRPHYKIDVVEPGLLSVTTKSRSGSAGAWFLPLMLFKSTTFFTVKLSETGDGTTVEVSAVKNLGVAEDIKRDVLKRLV